MLSISFLIVFGLLCVGITIHVMVQSFFPKIMARTCVSVFE